MPATNFLIPLLIDLVAYVVVVRLVARKLKPAIRSAREAALFVAVGSIAVAIIIGIATFKAISIMGFQIDITYNWFEVLFFMTAAALLSFPGVLGDFAKRQVAAVASRMSRIVLRTVVAVYVVLLISTLISIISFYSESHTSPDFGSLMMSLLAGVIFAPNFAFGGATWGLGEPLSSYVPTQFSQMAQLMGSSNPLEKFTPIQVILTIVVWVVVVASAATAGSKAAKSNNASWQLALAGAGIGLVMAIFTNFDLNGMILGPGYFAPIALFALIGLIFGAFESQALSGLADTIANVAKPVATPVLALVKKVPLINKL